MVRLRLDLLLKLRHFEMSQCYVSELEQQILSQAPLANRAPEFWTGGGWLGSLNRQVRWNDKTDKQI